MHIEKLADNGGNKLVVGRNGSLVVIALASYGAASMIEDAVVATKSAFARRKAAKLVVKPETPAA